MFHFLFNSIRTRNQLTAALLLAASLTVPLTAGAAKRRRPTPRLLSRWGRANLHSTQPSWYGQARQV